MGTACELGGGMAPAGSCARKVRIPLALYARLQAAAEAYQVDGGVSGIVRRALRAVMRRRFAPGTTTAWRCGRLDSTVMTVFLDAELAAYTDGMTVREVWMVVEAYLDLPRPEPWRLHLEPAAGGYEVVPMEAEA